MRTPSRGRRFLARGFIAAIAIVALTTVVFIVSQRRPTLQQCLLRHPECVFFRYVGAATERELDSRRVTDILSRAISTGWRVPIYRAGFQGGYLVVQKDGKRRKYLLYFEPRWLCLDGETSWTILMTREDHAELMEAIGDKVPLPPPWRD